MSINSEYNKKFVYKSLDLLIAHENPYITAIIVGFGPWHVSVGNPMSGSGTAEHSISDAMEGIYEYSTDHPEVNISEMFFNSVSSAFKKVSMYSYYLNAMKCLQYHINCEKEGIAPFTIDTGYLVKVCEEQLPRMKQRCVKAHDYNVMCSVLDNTLENLKKSLSKTL